METPRPDYCKWFQLSQTLWSCKQYKCNPNYKWPQEDLKFTGRLAVRWDVDLYLTINDTELGKARLVALRAIVLRTGQRWDETFLISYKQNQRIA